MKGMLLRSCLLFLVSANFLTAQQDVPATVRRQQPATTVHVSATLSRLEQQETARTVSVQDTQQHALSFESVEDYLRTDASVDIQQRSPAGVLSDVQIRGASFEQTLVLLNGLRINNAETAHFNLDLPVPLPALSRVHVLHGVGSTQYGSDAIGGVIDFSTLQPEQNSLRLNAGGGSFGENHQSAVATLFGQHSIELVSASRAFSTGFLPDRDYRTMDALSETRFVTPAGATLVTLAGDDRAFGAAQFFGNYNSWERTKSWFAAVQQQFTPQTQFVAGYRRHSDLFLLERAQPAGYKNQHIDEGYQAAFRDHRSLRPELALFSGLEFFDDQITSTNLGAHGRNRGAGYAEAEWVLPSHASITAGLREEIYSGGRTVTSPSLAAAWWVRTPLKLRAALNHGFRIPTYVDLYYSDPTTRGNPNLRPESAWNYEGGVDWYPGRVTSAAITIFRSRQKDTIDYTRANPAELWQASNLGHLNFTGTEASLETRLAARQQLRLSYTWLHGTRQSLNGRESRYVFLYPVHNARVEWSWRPVSDLFLQSRLGVLQRYGRGAYPVWDVSVARERGSIHPYLRLTNLTNTGYEELAGVRMPGRSAIAGVDIFFGGGKRQTNWEKEMRSDFSR